MKKAKNPSAEKYSIDMEDNIQGEGCLLYRITALRDIKTAVGLVKEGEKGGYIPHSQAINHNDNSWVYPAGQLDSTGHITGDAVLYSGKSEEKIQEGVIDDLEILFRDQENTDSETKKTPIQSKKTPIQSKKTPIQSKKTPKELTDIEAIEQEKEKKDEKK